MTGFLILIVVALLGITVWQMSKIFNLSRAKAPDDSGVANNKDNKNQGILMLVFNVVFYLCMIYCFWNYSKLYLPKAASEHGVDVDRLFFISIIVIMIVQVITQFLLFYFSYKYHGRKGAKALFYADNDKLEFVWTIIPVVVLACLIIYGLFTWSDIMNISKDKDTMVVELYAYQFGWKIRYSGEDNTLGKANVRFIQGVNTLGVDESDPYAKDDKIASVMHLPVGKKVLFKMRSQDVLHSAFFPFFRAQMNVVPGMVTQFGFTPTITTTEMQKRPYMVEKVRHINKLRQKRSKDLVANGDVALDEYEFEYFLLCNKVCGTSHYNMQMKIIVEKEDKFDKWLAEQETFGATMEKAEAKNTPAKNQDTFDQNQQMVEGKEGTENEGSTPADSTGVKMKSENPENGKSQDSTANETSNKI